jgi:curved DNA-binding protein CbpA
MSMNGALGEGVLPGLLRELYVGRKSGMLTLHRGPDRRGFRFRSGHIVHADTNVRDDRMGEVLVRHGRLSPADLKRAIGFSLRDNKRLGAVLVDLGLLQADQIEDALALHVHEILGKVFSWKDGTFEFTPEDDAASAGSEGALKVSTGELVLQAARSVTDPDVVRYCLGDIDRILGLASDPLLRFQRVTLTPADGYVLSRVDGTLSAREVVAMISLPREETHRSLYALLSTGMIEFLPLPPKARPADNRKQRAPSPVQMAAVEEEPLVLLPTLEPPSAEEAAAQTAAHAVAAQDDPRRMEILEAFAALKRNTHFEILQLERNATEAQVKEAYFRLARRFHPDVHHDPALADLRDKIEAIFVRLAEAYEVLRNPRIRAKYENQLSPAAGQAPPPSEPSPQAIDPEVEMREAAVAIKRAARLLSSEMYWDAIQVLEPAVVRARGKPRQEGRVLLARAYMKNVNWLKQGEELLLEVIKEDPAHGEACLLLSHFYRDQGLKARAAHMMRKVAELFPDSAEVRAELEALTEHEPDGGGARGGLLKRLFTRG